MGSERVKNLQSSASAHPPAYRERIDEVLRTVGLAAESQRRAGALAHGQKQWLELSPE